MSIDTKTTGFTNIICTKINFFGQENSYFEQQILSVFLIFPLSYFYELLRPELALNSSKRNFQIIVDVPVFINLSFYCRFDTLLKRILKNAVKSTGNMSVTDYYGVRFDG